LENSYLGVFVDNEDLMNFLILNSDNSATSLLTIRPPSTSSLNVQRFLRKQGCLTTSLHDIRQRFQDVKGDSRIPVYALSGSQYIQVFTSSLLSKLLLFSYEQAIVKTFYDLWLYWIILGNQTESIVWKIKYILCFSWRRRNCCIASRENWIWRLQPYGVFFFQSSQSIRVVSDKCDYTSSWRNTAFMASWDKRL
jgi:hypothetical protein